MPETPIYLIVTEVRGSVRAMARLKLEKLPGDGVKSLVRKELSQVLKHLAAARSGAKVHGARRGLKVVRSTLRLARPAMPAEAFAAADRLLREAARLLAVARHNEALTETIGKLGDLPAAVLLRKAASRTTAAGETASNPAETLAGAEKLVVEVRKSLRHWSLPRRDVAPYVAGLAACYRKARRTLRRGLKSGETARLHEARKSVIHHLHHLEALSALWPTLFKAWVADLNGLRLALGDLNDLDELERTLREQIDTETAKVIAHRRAKLIASAANISGPMFAEKPGAFATRMDAMWRRAVVRIAVEASPH